MRASARARSRSERSTGAESTTGLVLGWARMAQKPPAAAARVPESRSSSSSRPGRAQVHVRVDERRERVQALAVDLLGALGWLERLADLGDDAVAHQQVGAAVEAGARVEQPRAADQDGRRGDRRPVELERAAHAGWGSVVCCARTAEGAPCPASSS